MLPYLIAGVIGYGISKLFEDNKAPKYNDGGLIAPNGKPSNLTPEQYKLVRTKAFKDWFGDWESKQFKNNHKPHSEIYSYDTIALDENGEPRIWHRATNYDYTEFDTEYIYLGSKKSYVKQYGKSKEFFIKPQKTIFIDNQDIERQKLGIKFDYLAEYISDENGITRKGKNYDKLKKAFENQKEVLSVWEYFTLVGNKEILDLFKNWFNEYGFDSVMYWETGLKNNFGKYPVGLICLYFGNEIKLADGTNTTFDGNNPDIRFMAGGQVLNLNKIRKGQYEAKSDKIEIYLTNPKVLNGIGTNKWQLIIEYSNDIIVNQWFDTMNEALKTGAILLSDFLDSNNTETRFMAGGNVPKTSKDEYGNWSGEYLGNKFSIYKLNEGWKFSFTYYSPLIQSEKNYFSSDDFSPFKTKKDAVNTLLEKIK